MINNKKGVFFSADALIALGIILIVIIVAVPLFEFSNIRTNVHEDVLIVLSSLKIGELENVKVKGWIEDGTINDTNKLIVEQIGIFYVQNKHLAEELAEIILNDTRIAENIGIWYNGELLGSKNTSSYESSTKVDVARQIISGIGGLEEGGATGYSARAFLTPNSLTKYVYFGGYVGDGNITFLIKSGQSRVNNFDIELAINNNFDLYINGRLEGSYSGSLYENVPVRYNDLDVGPFRSENPYCGGGGCHTCDCDIGDWGDDIVEIRGKNLHVAGGFIKLNYNITGRGGLPDQSDKYYFPGINGLINIYDGFYVPGDLTKLDVYLHMNTNYTAFLVMGNKTIWNGTTDGEQTINIPNSNLLTMLNYNEISNKSIPLRLGLENVSYVISAHKDVDAISVTDISGSMDGSVPRFKCYYTCKAGGVTISRGSCLLNSSFTNSSTCNVADNPCQVSCDAGETLEYTGKGATRLDMAKEANNLFTDVLLNFSGNRGGLVAYHSSVPSAKSHDISNNISSLKSKINSWETEGNTCICCGINAAKEKFLSQSDNTTQKAMIVMSDGNANIMCAEQGTGGAKSDAIEAACDANATLTNLIIHTIAFGTSADNVTMKAIAKCGGGDYYYSDVNNLTNVYNQIVDNIIQSSYSEQTLTTTGNISTILYPDSYIEFGYNKEPISTGLFLTFENSFYNNYSGNFSIPTESNIVETRAISYSGPKWTDKVFINNSLIYNLASYGNDYIKLGDPYAINIPNLYVNGDNYNNVINVTLGLSPTNSSAGSQYNKIIYTFAKDFSAYSDVVPEIEGCQWNIEFEDGTSDVIGDNSLPIICSYNSTIVNYTIEDASQVAVYNLLKKLDFNNNNKSDYKFTEADLQIGLSQTSGIPFVKSNEIQVRVWR